MIILDTNVISELMRPTPDDRVIRWVDALAPSDGWTTSVTYAEIAAGIALLPRGSRQRHLAAAFDQMRALLDAHVLSFDANAASEYGGVIARRSRLGRPISVVDAQIAAIGITAGATIATRNTADFAETGADVVNPWAS